MTSFKPHRRPAPGKRKIKKVPFVELRDGRLQGVVSSGSDVRRVYVSFVRAGGDYGCATNNNRPCGGLRGSHCKHIGALLDTAIAQYGAPRVAEVLGVEGAADATPHQVHAAVNGSVVRDQSGEVFSRFLTYLDHLEREPIVGPLPELAWFVTG